MKEYILTNVDEILADILETVEVCGSNYSDYRDTLNIFAAAYGINGALNPSEARINIESVWNQKNKGEKYYSKLHKVIMGVLDNDTETRVYESELGLILEECPAFKYSDIVKYALDESEQEAANIDHMIRVIKDTIAR